MVTSEQYEAHKTVQRAIRSGVLVRPDECEHCGGTEYAAERFPYCHAL